jgi:hypothetical protein
MGDALGAPFEFGPGGQLSARFPVPARGVRTEMCGGGSLWWEPGDRTASLRPSTSPGRATRPGNGSLMRVAPAAIWFSGLGSEATPNARCLLTAVLLEAGRLDEARQVTDDLRRPRPHIGDIAGMAEVFERVGDLKQAHRWAAMGVSRLETGL